METFLQSKSTYIDVAMDTQSLSYTSQGHHTTRHGVSSYTMAVTHPELQGQLCVRDICVTHIYDQL